MVTDLTSLLRSSYAPGVPHEVEIPKTPLVQVLEDAAAFYPNRVALDFLGVETKYRDLAKLARKAATVLRSAGVRKGDRVALVLPNCPQHIVAFYGAAYLGAIVAEHNPLAPAAQLREQFLTHGAKVAVIWEKSFAQLAPVAHELGIKLLTVDLTQAMSYVAQFAVELPFAFARKQRDKLRPSVPVPPSVPSFDRLLSQSRPWSGVCPATSDEVAVLLHTGGTTGSPKAVKLTHRNLLANVAQSAAWVPELHEGAENFAAVLPFFHAFGMTLSLLAAVRMAATIIIFPNFNEEMILSAQRRRPITFFPGVAPMFKRLRVAAIAAKADLSSVRYSLSGAMPLDEQTAKDWEDLTGGFIIEGYGMTEAAPIILGNPVSRLRRPGTLGVPYPSTEIRIVDTEEPERDLPLGENGEILAKGPQVFAGYWDNPEETADSFAGDWLRTGDIGRVDEGFVVMADRKKELIITGGFNVYPSQVEEALRGMPGIEEVAVVGVPDASNGEKIVAAIVADGSVNIDLDGVRKWAEKKLSHYALPKQITFLSDLPRSQVGKVLRRTVREQFLAAGDTASAGIQQAKAGIVSVAEQTTDALRNLSDTAIHAAKEALSVETKSSNQS